MLPIMQLLLFGYVLNSDPKQLPTAIFLQDNSASARAFIAGLRNTDYFALEKEVTSEAEGRRLLQNGTVLFVVTIPLYFERDLVRGDHPKILIEADASDPLAIAGPLSAANGMISTCFRQVFKGSLGGLQGKEPPFDLCIHRLYNPEGFSRYNIVPGLVAILLTMTGIMMTALTMTRERERGTMENLLAMPVTPFEIMIGKIFPYLIIGIFQAVIIIFVSKILFKIPVLGNIFLFLFSLFVFIVCNIAIGFTISARSQTQSQASQMSAIITLPSILLTGFIFPFLGMPVWAQMIGHLLPATYFIRISRGIFLKGGTLAEIWPHLWPLLILLALIITLAMRCYRRTLD